MKNSVKIFVASLIVLACAVGFFLGTCCSVHCCSKHSCDRMDAPEKVAAAPEGHFKKGHEGKGFQKNWPHPAMFDSLLQVTPEQKTALDKHREETGKAFKELFGQKMSAEKELKDALDSGDEAQIEAAKVKILDAQKALLDNRIEGIKSINKIITKEQQEKFRQVLKENIEKFKKGHHGKRGPRESGPTPPPEREAPPHEAP
ncbi:MAG: Spy/CpxP family protein refolding chaperone [Fibrobacter sp.]|nr:Spy/CpxP family protein refolding chaperone [Fibrobacter sp.]